MNWHRKRGQVFTAFAQIGFQVSHELKAFVFDMDGVLIDSHPTHRAAWIEFLLSVGINPGIHELEFILEGRTRTEILRHFLGERPDLELQEHGRRKDEIFRRLEQNIKLAPGVLEFLSKLERLGICRAIATSASEIRTASTIERLGLGGFFDAVVTAADVTAGKPDPEVYQIACSRMNVDPNFALAFDDAPAGVIAARSAGLRCIGVTSDDRRVALLAAGAEAVITGFSELHLHASGLWPVIASKSREPATIGEIGLR